MGKTKKGLLIAGTVMTIVTCAIALIAAIAIIALGSQLTEQTIVSIFQSAPEMYEYQTNVTYQGQLYEYAFINWETNEIILSTDIAAVVGLFQMVFCALGFVVLIFAGIKLLLAIIALAVSGKKFAKGAVITLIVFSFLTFSWLEAGLLIGALSSKNKAAQPGQGIDSNQPEVMA